MKIVFKIAFFLLFPFLVNAQTGIGTTTPNASAKLDVTATDKGFLPPRVALTASNAAGPIPSPATGLLVYNTATAGIVPNNVIPGYYFWNGSAWINFIGSTTANTLTGTGTTSTLSGFGATIRSIPAGIILAATDNGTIIQSSASSGITITIPIGLPTGFNCMLLQMGTGQLTFAGGATLINRSNFTKSVGQYAIISIVHLGSNTVLVSGEMSN
jgi:hypothetical protein